MKDIPNFPGYKITEDGRVWSEPKLRGGWNKSGLWLKMKKDKDGYLYLGLCKDGKRFFRRVHRLVLETYSGPCPKGMEGCHNDGNLENNNIDNLRWTTHADNCLDKNYHGTDNRGVRHSLCKIEEMDVHFIRAWLKAGFSAVEIARVFDIGKYVVYNIKYGNSWKWLSTEEVK